ncbi:MAG: T9SS type A sorting domain-containing protein [Bacteroidetes bacterium]|nr:T9SS type A sorting domain-containing protein [Bacteroidota bacterium]
MKTQKLLSAVLTLYLIFSASYNAFSQGIAGGGAHSITVCSDGTVRTCGLNEFNGQLGDGTWLDQWTPVPVASLGNTIIAVAGGDAHSLFLKSNGTVWACGWNGNGQLGDGTTTDRPTPVQVASLGSTVIAIAAGGQHSLFLKSDGTVWACGRNSFGQLGDGTTTQRTTPVLIGNTVTAIAAGYYHSLFLASNGTAWSTGYNALGQLGDGTTTNKLNPVQVASLGNTVTAIAGGWYHSLFLKSNGTAWSTGYNWFGQLGDGTTTDKSTPIQVSIGNTVTAIAGGGRDHSLFLKNDGTAWACGDGQYGKLGDGTTTTRTTPVQVASLGNTVTTIAAGYYHSLFLKGNGTAWACGYNFYGELGDGTNTDRWTPVQMNTCVTPLPIELLSFTAQQDENNQHVRLNWTTATEINNDFFTLERSLDAINFEQIKTRQGAGNSNSVIDYVDYDKHPYRGGITYYRLKQTDFDGAFSYSDVRVVFLNELDIINLYPNPANEQITLIIGSSSDDVLSLQVVDVLGRILINEQYNILKGLTTLSINTSSLVSGSYIIKATNSKSNFTKKDFIKNQ